MALVVAKKRQFASCLLFPDFEVLHKWKEAQRQQSLTDEEFLNSNFVKDHVLRHLLLPRGTSLFFKFHICIYRADRIYDGKLYKGKGRGSGY